MPYESIADARKAVFPCSAEDIDLTLAQINELAEFYDTFKGRKNIENPMATAWKQWKEAYKKEGDKWVVIEKEGEQETHTRWIPVARANQEKRMKDGSRVILTEDALKRSVGSWKNGGIFINHKEQIDGLKVIDDKYESPFLYMMFNQCTENMFTNTDATGWSVQFVPESLEMNGDELIAGKGQGISILYAPHIPTCTPEMGCHETFDFKNESLEGDKMEEESKFKSVVEDIKGMFEQLMAVVKPKDKEEEDSEEPGKEKNMDKIEEMTSELATQKGEFETLKADHAKEVKELQDKVAAFEQEKVAAQKSKMDADWEQLKTGVIPPGLVSKEDDEVKLRAEFEELPHEFLMRMATFGKHDEQKEEGAEFSTEKDESSSAIKELKEETGRK